MLQQHDATPAIGIDLGTTNSLIGVWQDGESRLIPNALNEFLTPRSSALMRTGQYWLAALRYLA